jgi:hypothetical protein
MVAPAQPEGGVSSTAGRAGIPEPRVARSEVWTLGPCMARVEFRAPHGVQPQSWVLHEG